MKMKITPGIILSSALLLSPTAPSAEEEDTDLKTFVPYDKAVDVFAAGQNTSYAGVRIPVVINADGILIAAAEGRKVAADQGHNDIIISISKDNGVTWSEPSVAASDANNGTYNNPYLIYDRKKKTTVLFFQLYPEGVRERDQFIEPGWESPKTVRNIVTFSGNGTVWTPPKDVTSDTKHEDAAITCSGPNSGIRLSRGKFKGRLVVVFNEAVKFGDWALTAAYSDDNGKTWKLGERSEFGKGVNEVSVAETDNGGIYAVTRAWGGGGRRYAYSDDGGNTWSSVETNPDLPSPGCQNGMARYSHKDNASRGSKSRIIFASPVNGRSDAVIKMSYDNGKTWPVSKDFGQGPYGYSSVCPLEPGYFGVLFEKNDGKTISFSRVPLAWLTDGEDIGMGKARKKASGGKKRKKARAVPGQSK